MSTNSNCYCTSVVIKVPGIQGTGIIWETLTDAEKQEISDRAISPIREYVEESKAEVVSRENNVISLANQVEVDKNTTVDAKNVVVSLKDSVVNQITTTGQTWVSEVNTVGVTQKTNVTNEGNLQVSHVTHEGNKQVTNVSQEGATQIEHLQNIIKAEESTIGIRCYEANIIITNDLDEGSTINLPAPMYYLVGRDHIRVSWNGLILDRGTSFSEVGSNESKSTEIKLDIPLKAGDTLVAWTVPLGRGTTDELIERIRALEDALADLSRVVVYRE